MLVYQRVIKKLKVDWPSSSQEKNVETTNQSCTDSVGTLIPIVLNPNIKGARKCGSEKRPMRMLPPDGS